MSHILTCSLLTHKLDCRVQFSSKPAQSLQSQQSRTERDNWIATVGTRHEKKRCRRSRVKQSNNLYSHLHPVALCINEKFPFPVILQFDSRLDASFSFSTLYHRDDDDDVRRSINSNQSFSYSSLAAIGWTEGPVHKRKWITRTNRQNGEARYHSCRGCTPLCCSGWEGSKSKPANDPRMLRVWQGGV